MEIKSEKDVINYYLVQIIKNLKKSGIEDITTENVIYRKGEQQIRVRFFTEDQWKSEGNKATKAQVIMGKHFEGYKVPFSIVEFENTKYYVKNLLSK